MNISRREAMLACMGAIPAVLSTPTNLLGAAKHPRMGIVIHSYGARRFSDPIAFLEHGAAIQAGGVQTSIGLRDEAYATKVREVLNKQKMYLEGSISLPKDKEGVRRFSEEVEAAKRCGAKILRTVLQSGRRYEVFNSAEGFRKFLEQAKQSLALARPVIEKQEMFLAVENHKDCRVGEQLELIKQADSPQIGVCIDFGNNVALLEDPMATVEALAPYAFTTHVKEMGVAEYPEGFLLSEVVLGTGFLDLPKMVATLRKKHPQISLNLEMITRDPLKVPCLTKNYWATLENVPARQLAEALARVRQYTKKEPLPQVSNLDRDARIQREEENVRQCLRYAQEHLS